MSTTVIPFQHPNALALPTVSAADIEQAMTIGDLSKMPPAVRIRYYLAACESTGLNPLTRPFTPMKDQSGQVLLYANKDAAEQLRKRDRISCRVLERSKEDGLYCVTVEASTPDGRVEEAQGIVDIATLKGQALANAMMKAETKAKRRVTLALCGLGFPLADEGGGRQVEVNWQTGELREERPLPQLARPEGEAQKDAAAHQADLCGDPPLLHPIWATIADWYAEAGRPEQYAAYQQWACRRYRAATPGAIADTDLEDMAAKVYATLEPLIVDRQASQDTANFAREGTAKAQMGASEVVSMVSTQEMNLEDASGLPGDSDDTGEQGASWGPESNDLFIADEKEEEAAERREDRG